MAKAEVLLAARRSGQEARVARAEVLLDSLDVVGLTPDIVAHAGRLAGLRALDAIQLASALSLGDALAGFVAYDARLLDAAAAAGLPVFSPR